MDKNPLHEEIKKHVEDLYAGRRPSNETLKKEMKSLDPAPPEMNYDGFRFTDWYSDVVKGETYLGYTAWVSTKLLLGIVS